MRKIDRFLLAIVFLGTFWRLIDLAFLTEPPPPGGFPEPPPRAADHFMPPIINTNRKVVVLAALPVEYRAYKRTLPDNPVKKSEVVPDTLYRGTAFSLSEEGHWLTATHVAQGCKYVTLRQQSEKGIYPFYPVDRWRKFAFTDVAIMDSTEGRPGLPIAAQRPEIGDEGFFFGFPSSIPSAGYAVHLGRTRMIRLGGREAEPSDVWAVKELLPGRVIKLGGNSGGPVLNADGAVVGMLSAGSDRRGRMNSSVLLGLTGLEKFTKPANSANPHLMRSNYVDYGQKLRLSGVVALVDCQT